jgi:hypothetical protein
VKRNNYANPAAGHVRSGRRLRQLSAALVPFNRFVKRPPAADAANILSPGQAIAAALRTVASPLRLRISWIVEGKDAGDVLGSMAPAMDGQTAPMELA